MDCCRIRTGRGPTKIIEHWVIGKLLELSPAPSWSFIAGYGPSAFLVLLGGYLFWTSGERKALVAPPPAMPQQFPANSSTKPEQDTSMSNGPIDNRGGIFNAGGSIGSATVNNTTINQRTPARHLSPQVAQRIASELRAAGRHEIVILASAQGGAEASSYAREFETAISNAGWKVSFMNWLDAGSFQGVAVFISVDAEKNPPRGADILLNLLNSCGLQATGQMTPSPVTDPFSLRIGAQPI